MDNFNQIKKILIEENVSKYGFLEFDSELPKDLKELKFGISFAVRLSDFVMNQVKEKPTQSYFHMYRTINSYIDRVSLRLSLKLNELGYSSFIVPASQSINEKGYYYSGIFQHRTAATLSGIGFIGKSGCLITKEFGPRVRLGTVLTDMPMQISKSIDDNSCGSCTRCVDSCPAMAIVGNNWIRGTERDSLIDPRACSEYMSRHFKMIGRGSVCGLCVASCPIGTERIKNNA